MRALAEALRDRGDRFPFPFGLPANIYPGYLVEVLAAPRVGKSMLALNWAIHAAEHGLPVLVHTADTDYASQALRAVSILTGETMQSVDGRREYWSGWLRGAGLPIRWSGADVHDGNFHELVEAEAEYLGEQPAMVVVDVAQDLVRGLDDAASVQRVFRSLHNLARRTGSVVVALHHVVSGDAAGGSMFVRMEDSLYEKGRIPEIVMTMWRAGQDRLTLFLAKNRQGPDGQSVNLHVDYARARIWR